MREINASVIADTVARLCVEANRNLPGDVACALRAAAEKESFPPARELMDILLKNESIARETAMPICQDTGMAVVFAEVGQEVHITGNFEAAVHEGVHRGYVEGVKRFVVETVKLAGANPCPPMVLGVGIGGDFERVAEMAKEALMLPLDASNPDPYYAALEKELLTLVNETGIGPQGLGGLTTCLGLHIVAGPTHIAGLPVAVNVSCHVTRHQSAVL